MKDQSLFKYLEIDYYSATPKYLQLANSIIKAVHEGKIKKDEVLPSINELSFEFDISRDTAEKGYKHLKKIGILGSVPGKGYYVKNVDVHQEFKIFLLFNKLSTHKKIIYDSFVSSLGDDASIDFYIYNNDYEQFKKIINNRQKDYTHYVIITHFLDGGDDVHEIINGFPKEKLILLDKLVPGVTGSFGAIYENFEKDIYNALEEALPKLSKYDTIKIIFPEDTYYPQDILKGYYKFCKQYTFNYQVVNDIASDKINKGDVFINLKEGDLIVLIDKILEAKLQVGKDVGIISYNETPWKKYTLNGITTISTDFVKMGEMAANMILQHTNSQQELPFKLRLRDSL